MLIRKLNRYSFTFALVFLGVFFSYYSYASAATIGFKQLTGSYIVGDTINLKIYVDSSGESINAVSALVKFPSNLLTLKSISKSGSIINLWAQEPSLSNTAGTANLEGIILNGYTGSSGTIATLVFNVKSAGVADVKFNSASILANDGSGTNILSSKQTSKFTITNPTPNQITKDKVNNQLVEDRTIVISEVKSGDSSDGNKRFLITPPRDVKNNLYTIQIDSLDLVYYTDDGTHIFTSSINDDNSHIIKITAADTLGNDLSGVLKLSNKKIKIPQITYYPKNGKFDSFIILKGYADPNVDIEFTIFNTDNSKVTMDHTQTDKNGKFTFVNDKEMVAGSYVITGRAISKDGINSDYMPMIKISNKINLLTALVYPIDSDYAVPFIVIIFIIILILSIKLYYCNKACTLKTLLPPNPIVTPSQNQQ